MSQELREATAYTFQLGPFVDETDGFTPEASLTIAATDVQISKNGAAFANKNDATTLTSTGDSEGYYDCVLNTTDTGTLGSLDVRCRVSGALPVFKSFQVVAANWCDAMQGASGLQVDIVAISGDGTAAANLEADYDGTGYAKANSTIGTTTTNTDMLTAATVLTTQMTEAFAAAGVAPTLAQAVFYIQQHLRERSISGTTETVKKLDGATTAATNTLDDATNPTSVTAAT